MAKYLVLENSDGKVLRTFHWATEDGVVVQRQETRRLEVHSTTAHLDAEKQKYETLGTIKRSELAKSPFVINGLGRLNLVEEVYETTVNEPVRSEDSKLWYATLFILVLLNSGFLSYLLTHMTVSAAMTEELKQQVVQIVKRIPPRQKQTNQQVTQKTETEVEQKKIPQKVDAIKRKGALSVLGSLAKSNQRGGLNLGAVNTTAGPGLGGTAGSGGAQTSLYGKGLVAAPLGAGANMRGGGGYGTKGKGGGQAGYGKLSLVGSAGTNAIPLGAEAIIQGGLDKDLIGDVIRRNAGQIRFCYEQGLQGDPALNGRIAVDFTIGGNGQVKIAGIENTTLNSKLVEECILLRLRSWKFPLPAGGTDVKVSYPFVLRRTGNG